MTDKTQQDSTTETAQLGQATLRNGLVLALFALVCTGLIAITHELTKDRIAQAIEAALARRLNEIVSKDQYDNDVYHDCTLATHPDLLGSKTQKVYRMRKQGHPVALIMTTTAPEGYGGKIELLVGVYVDGQIAGVRVTQHQETPGLGDKIEIEKDNWIRIFEHKSLTNPMPESWKVSKDGGEFDALTGATITPRAVVDAVYKSLLFVNDKQNLQKLFSAENNCGSEQ